jgi:proteic killer suppression protein
MIHFACGSYHVLIHQAGRRGRDGVAIKSFRDEITEEIAEGYSPKKGFPPNLLRVARRKLKMLAAAGALRDLAEPPGNRLHELGGDRKGQHAIRVNDQFRVCFRWTDAGPEDVEITDYH